MLKYNIPLVFADGTGFYKELSKTYKKHNIGLFILAPSGAGKTHYLRNQQEHQWIDGDSLWTKAKAHPLGKWWRESQEVIDMINIRSDIITFEATKLGFWIMGASNYWLKPDAAVLPNWETHISYIENREKTNYDGGLTSNQVALIKKCRDDILKWKNDGVKIYPSIEEAVSELIEKF